MYFNLSAEQENHLQNLPETGMGYQVIEASKAGFYAKQKYLVLNSSMVIDIDGNQNEFVRKIIAEGIVAAKKLSSGITLTGIKVLNERELRGSVNEGKSEKEKGAIDNPKELADGNEMFTRLSAFDDDKRVDKVNNCLRMGSFATTQEDYLQCKKGADNPIERYALPSNDEIKFAFEIKPKMGDLLQRGIVQPMDGKRGGGKEAYFETGTSVGTFVSQHPY